MKDFIIFEEKIHDLLLRLKNAEPSKNTEPSNQPIDSYRLLHGRGRCFPGWENINIDFYQPVLVITCYAPITDDWRDAVKKVLAPLLYSQLSAVLIQHRHQPQAPTEIFLGELPEAVFAQRQSLKFELHLQAQQNLGYFLDMEPGRHWLAAHSHNKIVLNLFAYSCAFSVVAIAAGAHKVVNVDMSNPALNLGRRNHQLNKLPKEASEYVAENILKSWSRIKKRGDYDVVIIDPPSFQKGSFVAEKDYAKVIRRLPELMPQGGYVLACLNAPELSEDFLKQSFAENLSQAEFVERLKPSPDFPDVDTNRQLKLLVYKIPAVL